MTVMDRVGILVALAIVAIAVSYTVISDFSTFNSDIEQVSQPVKDLQNIPQKITEAKKTIPLIVNEAEEKVAQTSKMLTQQTQKQLESVKETVSSKLPSKIVKIPQGTSVPGCEEDGLCYDPPSLVIFVGGEVLWRNDDTSVHTVTSGSTHSGPDKTFDSGLIKSGDTFSYTFDVAGEYSYFCMIHPWAKGSVTVK